MKIHFLVPPPAQRIGGLDGAIDGLRAALQGAGAEVRDGAPSEGEKDCVVHFHGLWQWGYQAVARQCRRAGVPYVVSPHGMLEPWAWRHKAWKKRPYYHLFEKRFLEGAAGLLATAEPEAQRLRALLPRCRVNMVPLGTAGDTGPDYTRARQALGWRLDERVLLFLSRVHPKKGLDLLLQALATRPERPPARLVIVGDGDRAYVRELRCWTEQNSEALPRIDWIGAVWGEQRWPYFQGADLFCLPTHSENFGLVVLEAWQAGTPVLTTPGTPWAGELEGRGYLCEAQPESIAGALHRFWRDEPVDATGRARTSAWVRERFAWTQLAPRYLECYREALAAG